MGIENIITRENEEYMLSPNEFLELVNVEFKFYSGVLRDFVKQHSLKQCVKKVKKWRNNYEISNTTAMLLDDYVLSMSKNE